MNYTPEELLPLVQCLTEQYTEGESTSVTWETARQLMEAVLYCIGEYETGGSALSEQLLVSTEPVSAKTAYERGYRAVIDKTVRIQKLYETVLEGFNSRENRACRDTVVVGLPEFFLHPLRSDGKAFRPPRPFCPHSLSRR